MRLFDPDLDRLSQSPSPRLAYDRSLLVPFFLLSLLFHLMLSLLIKWSPSPLNENSPVEVTLSSESVPKEHRPQSQFLSHPNSKKENVEPKKKPDFFSTQTVRTAEETVAALEGPNQKKGDRQEKIGANPSQVSQLSGLQHVEVGSSSERVGLNGDSVPFSSGLRPERMEKSRIGELSVLNADESTYGAFFQRLSDRIYSIWESQITQHLGKLDQGQKRFLVEGRDWITDIQVDLDPDGVVLAVLPLKSSGYEAFDLVETKALKTARTFPNPPRQLVEDDNKIHLKLRFHIRLQ